MAVGAFIFEEENGGPGIVNPAPSNRQGAFRPLGSTGGGGFSQPPIQVPVLTSAGNNAAQGAEIMVKNTNEDWINKKWRPAMGWTYMGTCIFDFVVAPVLWSVIQALGNGGQVATQWQPLTLQGAGLYHLAMGAVLGIAAYGRTQEKISVNTPTVPTVPKP
jgi:hypothetical protein